MLASSQMLNAVPFISHFKIHFLSHTLHSTPKLPSLNRPFLFSIHIVAGTLHYSATAAATASAVEEKLVAFSGNIANEGEGEKCELWLQTKLGSGGE